MWAAIKMCNCCLINEINESQNSAHHHHSLQANWWQIKLGVDEEDLHSELRLMQSNLGNSLSRVKGIVATNRGMRLIEISPSDTHISISPYTPTYDQPFWTHYH
jgi:G3E family GTPase